MGADQGQREPDGAAAAGSALTWESLDEFAQRLADLGHEVCQLHHHAQIPVADWVHNSHTATLHSHAGGDFVVTSDGARHNP